MKKAWDGQHKAFGEALKYMLDRSTGKEKSIYTPWPKFNDAVTDGLEWNTLTVIGGRPGSGKTLIKDQIVRESFVIITKSSLLVKVTDLQNFSKANESLLKNL